MRSPRARRLESKGPWQMATEAQPCSPSSNRERKRGSTLRSNALIAALVHISAATLALSSPQLHWAPCVLRLNASPPYELRLDARPAAAMRLGQVARLASPLCPAGPFLQLRLALAQPPQSQSHRFCPCDTLPALEQDAFSCCPTNVGSLIPKIPNHLAAVSLVTAPPHTRSQRRTQAIVCSRRLSSC